MDSFSTQGDGLTATVQQQQQQEQEQEQEQQQQQQQREQEQEQPPRRRAATLYLLCPPWIWTAWKAAGARR